MPESLETSIASNESSKIKSENYIEPKKISDWKAKFQKLKTEIIDLLKETNKNQEVIHNEQKTFVGTKVLEQKEIEEDKADKQKALVDLKNKIEKTKEKNENIKSSISTNKSNIKKNNCSIKDLKSKITNLESENQKLKNDMTKLDIEANKKTRENIQKFNGTKEQEQASYELQLLEENNEPNAKILQQKTENLDALMITNSNLIHKINQQIQDLSLENTSSDITIKNNQELIKNNQEELKNDRINKNILTEEIKALEAKIAAENKKTKTIVNEFHNKKETELSKYANSINAKKEDIVAWFNDFKIIEAEINKNYQFFKFLQPRLEEFLMDYFIKKEEIDTNVAGNGQSVNDGILVRYEQNIKNLKDYVSKENNLLKEEKQNNEKYELALSGIENFSNKITNEKRRYQEYDSNITQLIENPKAVMKIGVRYQHFLQENKLAHSHLLCLNSEDIDKKEKSFFYFAKMLLFKECNENMQGIFDKLKGELKQKINKNIVFDQFKKYALLIIKDNDGQSVEFLIDFSMIIKLPKRFISILNNYEKIYDLDEKIFNKINVNFQQKNNKLIKLYDKESNKYVYKKLIYFYENKCKNNNTSSNIIINNIKNLEYLYNQIIDEKNELINLKTLLSEFYSFLDLNCKIFQHKLDEIKIKSDRDFGAKNLDKTVVFFQEILKLNIFNLILQPSDSENINVSYQNPQPSTSACANFSTNVMPFPTVNINKQANNTLNTNASPKVVGGVALN